MPDVIAGSADDNLYALNGQTGALLWSRRIWAEVLGIAYTDDCDRDGRKEIVCGSRLSSVNALYGRTGINYWRYPFSSNGAIFRVLQHADITGEGIKEVIAVSDSGIVNCLSGLIIPSSTSTRSTCCSMGC